MPDTQGFRKIGEADVYDGYVMQVTVGTFEGPDGHRFTRDLLHHPGAVAVVPVHDDGSITLVRQYRPALERTLLEIPAGIRDVAGESAVSTAARELAEEAGLTASSMEHLLSFHNAPGYADEVVDVFVARGLAPVEASAQSPEESVMTVERHALADLWAMIGSGDLTDAKTVIAVAMLHGR